MGQPAHIERWRAGAEGERQTGRALRPLKREGWTLLHDLPGQWGNIDHVLIGPPGVFLLETKTLGGAATITDDVLQVRWLENPDDGYTNAFIAARARAASARLSRELVTTNGRRPWVQSIVVLWSRFEQGTVEHNRVIWTHGSQLRHAIAARTHRHG